MITPNATLAPYIGHDMKPVWTLTTGEFVTYFSSGTFNGITASFLQNIENVQYFSQIPTPIENNFQPAYATIDFSGDDSTLLLMIMNRSMLGKDFTLNFGVREVGHDDFFKRFRGKVDEIKILDFQRYRMRLVSYWPAERQLTCRKVAAAKLNAQMANQFYHGYFTNSFATSSTTMTASETPGIFEKHDVFWYENGTSGLGYIKETIINQSLADRYTIINQNGLAFNVNSGDTLNNKVINLDSSPDDFFNSNQNFGAYPWISGRLVQIGTEIIRCDSKNTLNSWLISDSTLDTNRGYLDTPSQRHHTGTSVREVWAPADEAMSLCMSYLTTTTGGANGTYDYGLEGFGAGIDLDLIAHATLAGIDVDNNFIQDEFQPILIESKRIDELVFQDIMTPAGVMPYIDGNGKISAKKFEAIDPVSFTTLLSDANGDFLNRNLKLSMGFINSLNIKYDYKPKLGFDIDKSYIQPESQAAYGISQIFNVHSNGLRSSYDPDTWLNNLFANLIQRYANPPLILNVDMPLHRLVMETGDIVKVTDAQIPKFSDGTRGISNVFGQIVTLDIFGFDRCQAKIELPNQGYQDVDLGVYDSVQEAGIDATSSSSATANFNTTLSSLIQTDDARYSVIDGLNLQATRVKITFGYTINKTIDTNLAFIRIGVRVGSGLSGATLDADTMTTVELKTFLYEFNQELVGDHYFENSVEFVDLPLDYYDVKLDFWDRSNVSTSEVIIKSIVYSDIQPTYNAG